MIIFLYGKDTYRSKQKLDEIINHYQKIRQGSLNLRYFDCENLNFQDFKKELEISPMFQEKKLIVIRDIFSNKNFQEEFLKEREKLLQSEDVILIYESKEVDKKNPLFQFLTKEKKSKTKEKGWFLKFQEFDLLSDQKLKHWIRQEFRKYQMEIKTEALLKLIEFVGNDLWRLSNEIKKLATYKLSHKLNTATSKIYLIEKEDIDLLVRPKIDADIFKTIDAIALKNKRRALELLHKHLKKGDDPRYLLSMINFQFRNLLLVKSLESRQLYEGYMESLAKKIKIHPFVLKKTMFQAKRFNLEELKKIYQKIFETDLNIKTGKIEPEIALGLLIAEI